MVFLRFKFSLYGGEAQPQDNNSEIVGTLEPLTPLFTGQVSQPKFSFKGASHYTDRIWPRRVVELGLEPGSAPEK